MFHRPRSPGTTAPRAGRVRAPGRGLRPPRATTPGRPSPPGGRWPTRSGLADWALEQGPHREPAAAGPARAPLGRAAGRARRGGGGRGRARRGGGARPVAGRDVRTRRRGRTAPAGGLARPRPRRAPRPGAAPRRPLEAAPVSRFPSSDIDLAFVVPDEVPAQAVERPWSPAGGELLESVELFDVYRGDGLGGGVRSLAFRLRFCAPTARSPTRRSAPAGRMHHRGGAGPSGHPALKGARGPAGVRHPRGGDATLRPPASPGGVDGVDCIFMAMIYLTHLRQVWTTLEHPEEGAPVRPSSPQTVLRVMSPQ